MHEATGNMGDGMAFERVRAVGCTLVVGDPQPTLCFVVPVTVPRSVLWIQNDWLGLHPPEWGIPWYRIVREELRYKKWLLSWGCNHAFRR
jgi:hypothetical protein